MIVPALARMRKRRFPHEYMAILHRFLQDDYRCPEFKDTEFNCWDEYRITAALHMVGCRLRDDPVKVGYRAGRKRFSGVDGLRFITYDISRDLAGIFGVKDRTARSDPAVIFIRALSHLPSIRLLNYDPEFTERLIEKQIEYEELNRPDVGNSLSMFNWSMRMALGANHLDQIEKGLEEHINALAATVRVGKEERTNADNAV